MASSHEPRPAADYGLHASPQARALGIETVALDPDVVLRIAYRADLVGDPDTGVIAGGAVTTLLDHACGESVVAAMGRLAPIATLDLRIDYMRPATPGLAVYASARCYKLTNSIAFIRAVAYDHDVEDPVAHATATFMITADAAPEAAT